MYRGAAAYRHRTGDPTAISHRPGRAGRAPDARSTRTGRPSPAIATPAPPPMREPRSHGPAATASITLCCSAFTIRRQLRIVQSGRCGFTLAACEGQSTTRAYETAGRDGDLVPRHRSAVAARGSISFGATRPPRCMAWTSGPIFGRHVACGGAHALASDGGKKNALVGPQVRRTFMLAVICNRDRLVAGAASSTVRHGVHQG